MVVVVASAMLERVSFHVIRTKSIAPSKIRRVEGGHSQRHLVHQQSVVRAKVMEKPLHLGCVQHNVARGQTVGM